MEEEIKITSITDISIVIEYFEERWQALTFGKGTGHCEQCHGCCKSDLVIGLSIEEAKKIPHSVIDGHAVIMPDANGVCPFLVDNVCSIYRKRPGSCRVYDCRDLAFSGILITDDKKVAGTAEVNQSVVRHIHDNGDKIFLPMRYTARDYLENRENNASKASQAAMLVGLLHVLPPEKAKKMKKVLLSSAEKERAAAQEAGIKARTK